VDEMKIFFCVAAISMSFMATDVFANCSTSPEAQFWSDVQEGERLPDPQFDIFEESGPNPANQANTTVPPFNAFAKFDSSVAGKARRCTAQFVGPNIVLTAAHCVRDKNGTWLDYFEFTPVDASLSGKAEAVCMATLGSWVTGNNRFDWSADLAFIVFADIAATNFLDLADSEPLPTDNQPFATGFPRSVDGGQVLHQVLGQAYPARSWGNIPTVTGQDTAVVIHGDTRLTLGMSGGAWIVPPLKSGGRHRVTGLSTTVPGHGSLWGPSIQSCAQELFSFAVNGCAMK